MHNSNFYSHTIYILLPLYDARWAAHALTLLQIGSEKGWQPFCLSIGHRPISTQCVESVTDFNLHQASRPGVWYAG